eukprot:g1536.t1
MPCAPYKHCRVSAWSEDGGMTFGNVTIDSDLPDPMCKAGVTSLPSGLVLFANDANDTLRVNVTVRRSLDGGRSWFGSEVIYGGTAGYVDIVASEENAFVVFEKDTCSIMLSTLAL